MALHTKRDIAEYFIFSSILDVAAAGTKAFLPVPEGGQVVRMGCVVTTTFTVADTIVTLESKTVELSGSLTIPFTASAAGRAHVTEMNSVAAVNEVLTPEDADLLAAGGSLELISDGGSTVGSARFWVAIRR